MSREPVVHMKAIERHLVNTGLCGHIGRIGYQPSEVTCKRCLKILERLRLLVKRNKPTEGD